MEQEKKGKRSAYKVEPSPYDLTDPLAIAPERNKKDPRIADQRLTAFWVTVKGGHAGRVVMVEFEDRAGWWYKTEVCTDPHQLPEEFGDPFPHRREAAEAVVDEWKARTTAARRKAALAA